MTARSNYIVRDLPENEYKKDTLQNIQSVLLFLICFPLVIRPQVESKSFCAFSQGTRLSYNIAKNQSSVYSNVIMEPFKGCPLDIAFHCDSVPRYLMLLRLQQQ